MKDIYKETEQLREANYRYNREYLRKELRATWLTVAVIITIAILLITL